MICTGVSVKNIGDSHMPFVSSILDCLYAVGSRGAGEGRGSG